jgi:hypothetical protein
MIGGDPASCVRTTPEKTLLNIILSSGVASACSRAAQLSAITISCLSRVIECLQRFHEYFLLQ